MPNPRDELPPLPPGWEINFIKRPEVEPFIRDLPKWDFSFEGHPDDKIWSGREREWKSAWDPGPSWQQVARLVFAWVPDEELRDIARWEDDGGRTL